MGDNSRGRPKKKIWDIMGDISCNNTYKSVSINKTK